MRIAATLFFFAFCSSLPAQAPKKAPAPKPYMQCAGCHGASGQGGMLGPKLTGLYKRKSLTQGGAVNDANVSKLIQKGVGTMPAMPHIEGEDLKAILSYLRQL
jgi:mono/diheme cytochrome c family protein